MLTISKGFLTLKLLAIFKNKRLMSTVTLQRPLLQRSKETELVKDLKELEELKRLKKVTSLKLLYDYGIGVLSNACQHLLYLKSLHIQNSNVHSLECLGTNFPKVKDLSIVGCLLRNLEGVESFPNLEVLRVPGNELVNVEHCIYLSNLTHLDLERNFISDLKSLERLSWCPKLASLILVGNPLYSESENPTTQEAVLKLLPRLKYIDGHPVNPICDQQVEGCWWSPSNLLRQWKSRSVEEKFLRISLSSDSGLGSSSPDEDSSSKKIQMTSSVD